ncbi:MAG: hypothetical protein KGL39_07240 [Patescibacteria group bacterium]|nr:hypothetical protein [Patescibacteria group bacterium]
MSTKHTLGPWHVSAWRDEHHVQTATTVVAQRIYQEADARLIAAAPDLLAALRDAADTLERVIIADERYGLVSDVTYKQLAEWRAAIAKAVQS